MSRLDREMPEPAQRHMRIQDTLKEADMAQQNDPRKAKVSSITRALPKKEGVTRRKLGELLVETGLLSPEKLTEALQVQKESGKRLGQILIDMSLISEEEMAFALAMQLKIPYVDLGSIEISGKTVETIPEEVCQKFSCVPIAL
jgi:hypothetical protein